MRIQILLALAFGFAVLGACGGDGGKNTAPTSTRVDECAANLAAQVRTEDVTWEEILPEVIPAPEAWEVRRSEGEGQFLTVLDGDAEVGTVELIQFPQEKEFDPFEGVDALYRRAADYYEDIEADRKGDHGDSYVLEREDPVDTRFGEFCGISYGFTGTLDGEVLDEVAAFATFDYTRMYLVVTSYGVEDGFKSVESLRDYEASLGELVASLRFPVP